MATRKPQRSSTTKSWTWTGIFLAVFVVGAVLIYLYQPKKTQPTFTTDQTAITLTATDGVKLYGNLYAPQTSGTHPAVILLHDYGYDRHQWDTYRQQFLDAGFVVLQYDMRGFGASALPSIPASTTDHVNSLPGDVAYAVDQLKQLTTVDGTKISVVGAGVGGSVAYVASGSDIGLYRTVLIAPTTFGTALDGSTVTNFTPKNVFGVGNTATKDRVTTLLKKVSGDKQTQTVDSSANGMGVVSSDLVTTIITWLNH